MRDIERGTDFVIAPGFAILRKLGFDLDPRDVEEVAESILVFVGVEAPKSGAAALGSDGAFVCGERAAQAIHKLLERFGGRLGHSCRRHLTRSDTIMHFDPRGEVVRIARVVAEFREVEPSGGGGGVVTDGAVFLEEGVGTGERRGRGSACRGDETSREDQLLDQPPK